MNQFITAFFLFLFMVTSGVYANDIPIKKSAPVTSAVGLSAGWVVGNGLIYRKYIGQQIFQVTFAGLIDKDEKEEYLNLSFSYARYLNRFNYSTPIGLKWIIGGEAVYDKSDNMSDNQINIGSGLGIDIGQVLQPGFTVSFDLIYTASFVGLKSPEFNALDLRPALSLLYNY